MKPYHYLLFLFLILLMSCNADQNVVNIYSGRHYQADDLLMDEFTCIVQNMARRPQGNDRDQVKGITAGVGDMAIVNTYYLGLLLNSGNPYEREVAEQVGIFFPNQDDRGTHINISGIGLQMNVPNRDNAASSLGKSKIKTLWHQGCIGNFR